MTQPLDPAAFPRDSVCVRARQDLTVLHVEGDDRREWLNGQLTNDVRHTRAGEAVYALAVTVRGKIMADVWMLDEAEWLTLLLPLTRLPTLLESFDSQIIMEDVELSHRPELSVISVQGPRAAAVVAGMPRSFACDELGYGGFMLLVASGEREALEAELVERVRREGGGPIDEPAWELARLRAGRPRFGVDFDDKHYPQEAGLEARAVSFQKGCYLGQEVICTLESRGRLSRRLVQLRADQATPPEPGADVHDEAGQQVGLVTSAATDPQAQGSLAMAYVKRACAASGTRLHVGGTDMRVDRLIGE